MVKSKAFRKLVALTAAIALVCIFAVSAGAVTVTSVTTTYTNDLKVEVTASVTALAGAEVTYYAANGTGAFFLDQTTADATTGAAQFKYVTDAANLKSTAILNETAGTKIDDTIPGYEVSFGGVVVEKIPETNTGATVYIEYTLPSKHEITSVTANGDEISKGNYVYNDGSLMVILGTVSADTTIAVTTEETEVVIAEGEYIAGAAMKDGSKKNDDTEEDATGKDIVAGTGDRKLTVIGRVSGTDDFGIIISKNQIAETDMDKDTLETYNHYKAIEANADGYFAVQLIDISDETTANPDDVLISATGTYYAAVYYKDGESYKIADGTETIKPQ